MEDRHVENIKNEKVVDKIGEDVYNRNKERLKTENV